MSTTVDAELLDTVDRFIETHGETNRSRIIEEALRLWAARERERATEAQFATPQSPAELEEHATWRRIRRASAATRLFQPR